MSRVQPIRPSGVWLQRFQWVESDGDDEKDGEEGTRGRGGQGWQGGRVGRVAFSGGMDGAQVTSHIDCECSMWSCSSSLSSSKTSSSSPSMSSSSTISSSFSSSLPLLWFSLYCRQTVNRRAGISTFRAVESKVCKLGQVSSHNNDRSTLSCNYSLNTDCVYYIYIYIYINLIYIYIHILYYIYIYNDFFVIGISFTGNGDCFGSLSSKF